jgi:hypothetical protein
MAVMTDDPTIHDADGDPSVGSDPMRNAPTPHRRPAAPYALLLVGGTLGVLSIPLFLIGILTQHSALLMVTVAMIAIVGAIGVAKAIGHQTWTWRRHQQQVGTVVFIILFVEIILLLMLRPDLLQGAQG